MSRPVILRPEADGDIRDIVAELELTQPGAARRFLRQMRDLVDRLEVFPEMYGVVWRQVRAARLRRFRYVAYHITYTDRVELIAVVHGSRDAPAWQSRA